MKTRILSVAFAVLAISSLAAASNAPALLRRYAFVAGANDGGEGLVRLKYAESDARSFATVLQDLGGVRPQDLVLVVNPDAGRFEDALARVSQMIRAPRELDERRELVVYYSGHSDDEGLILGKERVSWEDLRRDIADIPADVKIAILDSCSSGSLTRAKGGVVRQAFLYDASSDMTGHAFLTSASAEEAAQESDRIGGSFFTHFLISGLRGAADSAGDGLVTLDEAYAYAYKETLASTENTQYGAQHPATELDLAGTGSIVLTDLRSSAAHLTVADDIAGRMYLRDTDGNLAVELNKVYGQTVDLGLEPGTYSVVLDSKSSRYAADVRVTSKQPAVLTLAQLKPIPVDKATARGDGSPAEADQPTDSAEALGAALGATIGSAVGKAASAVNAAITAAAAIVNATTDAAPPAEPSSPQDEQPAPAAPLSARPRPFELGIFPDFSDGVFSSRVDHVAAVNLFVGTSGSSLGFEVGSLANFESGNVYGFQAAGLVNAVKGNVLGFQSAGLVNYVEGDAGFFQSAGLVNVSGNLLGGQASGIANLARGEANGAQVAGILNWSRGAVRGAQIAGVINWAEAGITGVQVSGAVNWGSDVKGPQISVINVAGSVSGVQLGVINIARHVTGVQIGVFNFSEQIDGVPLGLISIEARGRHDVDLWMEIDGASYMAFSLGARHLYTILSAGWMPGTDPVLWSLGLGLGGRSELGPFFLDYDASLVAARTGFTDWSTTPVGTMYPRARVVLGLPLLGGGIAVDAGVSVRVLVPYLSSAMTGADPSGPVLQPSFILGVNL